MSKARLLLSRLLHGVVEPSIAAVLPVKELVDPVFVLGCGRSGTTALGRILSRHSEITYLNEPRALWAGPYPQTDIWSRRAAERGGRLSLSADECRAKDSARMRKIYRLQTLRQGGRVLIDKLPINSFRVDFLRGIWPSARFIHIVREGREVARSIARLADRNEWFGAEGYKWSLLSEFARDRRGIEDVDALCASNYERGLLEWTLSVSEVVDYFAAHPGQEVLEVTYADFVEDPAGTVERCTQHVGVSPDPALLDDAARSISRRSRPSDAAAATEREQAIAGAWLERYATS